MNLKNIAARLRNKLLIAGLTGICALAGCGAFQTNLAKIEGPLYQRHFFNRAVKYEMGAKAREGMKKAKNLQSQIHPNLAVDGELPDKTAAAMYRDADIDRNRIISEEEAEAYLNQITREYMESLPSPDWVE